MGHEEDSAWEQQDLTDSWSYLGHIHDVAAAAGFCSRRRYPQVSAAAAGFRRFPQVSAAAAAIAVVYKSATDLQQSRHSLTRRRWIKMS